MHNVITLDVLNTHSSLILTMRYGDIVVWIHHSSRGQRLVRTIHSVHRSGVMWKLKGVVLCTMVE